MKIERLVLAAAIAIATPVAPIGAAVAQTDTAPRGEAKGGPRTDGIVVFNGLNKITARIVELDAPIGKPIEFGALVITPRACQKAPPEEPPEAAVFVEISEHKPGEVPQQLFSGWMFASSPACRPWTTQSMTCGSWTAAFPMTMARPTTTAMMARPPSDDCRKHLDGDLQPSRSEAG